MIGCRRVAVGKTVDSRCRWPPKKLVTYWNVVENSNTYFQLYSYSETIFMRKIHAEILKKISVRDRLSQKSYLLF